VGVISKNFKIQISLFSFKFGYYYWGGYCGGGFLCFKAYFSSFMIYPTSLFTPIISQEGGPSIGRKTC